MWLERGWCWLLHAGFLLLCLRFLVAATRETYPDVLPVLVLTAGGLGLSAWRPRAALFAFTISVPLLNGLGYVGLAELPAPVSLVFSGVFVGWTIRQLSGKSEAQEADLEVTGWKSSREPITHNPRPGKAVLVIDVLISVVLLSLAVQIARQHGTAGFWTTSWSQPVFGYGDSHYFMTSAFVWLQGLFFFRLLRVQGGDVLAWAKSVFAVYGVTLVVFYLLQLWLHVPEPIDSITYCSPLEDIHSFGGITVAIFAAALVSWVHRSWAKTILNCCYVAAILALLVASWSRATWLAGILVLLLIAWIRLPRRWSMAVLALGIMVIAIINLNANRASWQHNGYLARLISLTRMENLINKSPDRLNLYYKTVGMIREHPFVGHGVGSTYLTSVRFARPGDPNADIPNFVHNFLLQMAAELGVPVAALFLALILFALWRGYRKSGARNKFQVPSSKFQDHGGGNPEAGDEKWKAEDRRANAEAIRSPVSGFRYHEHAMLGVSMALTAYLITQMTANALNIYVSNQFFFWFLMAALLSVNTKCGEHTAAYPSASISVE